MFSLLWTLLLAFFGYRNFKVAYTIFQMDGKMTGKAWLYTGIGALMAYFVLNRLGVLSVLF